jgi:hypothetical protein
MVKRDAAWASQVASERPALTTRIQCDEDSGQDEVNQGSIGEDRVARFNEQLRSGIGTGRPTRDE